MKKILLGFILFLFFITNVEAEESASFSKCIDGDTATFIINGENIKVRFLAINSPEMATDTKSEEPYAKEAADYTCEKIKNAQKIELEYEDTKYDKYGRLLAWIWIDDSLLQKELVKEGLAKVAYLYDVYKYSNLLKEEEIVAKQNQKGIWSNAKETTTTTTAVNIINKNTTYSYDMYIPIIIGIIFIYILLKLLPLKKKGKRHGKQ